MTDAHGIALNLFDSDTREIISNSAGDSDLTPAAAARGSEESAAFNSPETANETPSADTRAEGREVGYAASLNEFNSTMEAAE